MAKVVDLNSYSFSGNERLLVDTNIWQYIFGIQASNNDHGYSDLIYSEILPKNVPLFINSHIASEYVNVATRFSYYTYADRRHKNLRYFKYKQNYRPTSDFKRNYEIALDTVKNDILSVSSMLPISANTASTGVDECMCLDFNDEILVRNAMENKLGILTHDRDYQNYPHDITIYTFNV